MMMLRVMVLLVLVIMLNIPIVSALELSNVRAVEITDNSALIRWETDEPADSFLSYGEDNKSQTTKGDASEVTSHEIAVTDLKPETTYSYSIKSAGKIEDNSGNLYSFTTPVPDKIPPELVVELPSAIQGNKLTVSGKTEIGATVKLYLDGLVVSTTQAISSLPVVQEVLQRVDLPIVQSVENNLEEGNLTENVVEENQPVVGAAISQAIEPTGKFVFSDITLKNNQDNLVKIVALDKAGNNVSVEGKVFADTSKPKLQLEKIPEFIGANSFELKGTISEQASYEIIVNNKSEKKGEGISIKETIRLVEGENKITIVLTDAAGWESLQEFTISSDTRVPTVKFEFSKGQEFYQGRARSDINGETEPGAEVYLYVYRPIGYEFNPKFDKAWEKVTADSNGAFNFEDVNLERLDVSFEKLAPKEIPSELLQETILSMEQIQAAQKGTYYVYVIAEDKSGKTGFAKKIATVNTCFSADSDFQVESLAQFQAPLRLNPTLLDSGREEVTAVFQLKYKGPGTAKEGEEPFQIQNVQFEKACTPGMLKDESTQLGCNLFPNQPRKTPSADKTAYYLTAKLNSADKFSENKEDFWNEFKKRQIVFPLKMTISYRENLGNGQMGETKTQVVCSDLSYFVDIPVDSKDMLPDFIANEGLQGIEWTIDKIDLILPYLEKAILVVGIAWVSSFLGRLATRYLRLVTSKLEIYFTKTKPADEQCPADQQRYYLESTIKDWKELQSSNSEFAKTIGSLRSDWEDEEKSLDKLCPMTANLWKAEAVLDQIYRWSGDRFLCRAVPAGWTSTKEKDEVDTVIMKQNQCTASSRGVPLQEIENCEEKIKENTNVASVSPKAASLINKGSFTCYQNGNFLYTVKPQDVDSVYAQDGRVMQLELVHDFGLSLQQADLYAGAGNLLAYKPYNADQFIIAQDKSCQAACQNQRMPGYRADTANGITNANSKGASGRYGCFREAVDSKSGEDILINDGGAQLGTNQFSAGYTNDCFIDVKVGGNNTVVQKGETELTPGATGLLQCVCTLDKEKERIVQARTALKETEDGVAESWIYRQDQIYKDSKNRFGTYYPEWRYYAGRDFSSAFGADYLIDYFREEKQAAKVSPNTQFLGAYQTLCLSQIRAQIVTLRSILEGLRNCIEQAKITGLRDAGICKTIFTQQVCGLIYKAISYFFTSCSPYSVSDSSKEALGGVGAISEATFGSIGEAMDSSIADVKSDYGNAKINDYFATGSQGFTQSLCMAAFGYDWPLGTDFLLDAAYSVPSKSTVHVFPANRELSTFDPTTGNAIYNYEVGAMILPGCNIQSYNIYLKCVGPEDRNNPGVQCGKQGCDCLNVQQPSSALESEKITYLEGGRSFSSLKQNTFFTPPIPSPQKVNKKYRYDHVVVELNLQSTDKGNEDKCFDEGYQNGKFYFPIVDISPPGAGVCQVNPLTGEYFCPEFVKLFGGGEGAYLQDPFVSCYDKNDQSWGSCDKPNLFTKGDQIKVRANAFVDGNKKYCIKLSTSGTGQSQDVQVQQLPVGLPGTYPVEFPSLGTVEPSLFTGAATTMVLSSGEKGCESSVKFSGSSTSSYTLTFNYQFLGSDSYRVFLPQGVSVSSQGYGVNGATLTKDGRDTLTSAEIRAAQFTYQGFQFSNVVGAPQGGTQCTYQIRPAAGTGYKSNEKTIYATAELLLPDAAGNCYNSEALVKTAVGKAKWQQPIRLQLDPIVSQVASQMHQAFIKKSYPSVTSTAKGIIGREISDIEDAVAIYYLVAAEISEAQQKNVDWKIALKNDICHQIKLFKTRDTEVGRILNPYPAEVVNSAEYQKIATYLNEIEAQAQCGIII
ncbi:MAG: fibronectin type III domain-containing protein [Nanoarchaeota archaeon]|nr:fibronectin type III domain-containing protein [Nanoarchaeota archaeon]MBU1976663.1 fibronectin type III domain-containing protein [Nanoarchaeota archaeon]